MCVNIKVATYIVIATNGNLFQKNRANRAIKLVHYTLSFEISLVRILTLNLNFVNLRYGIVIFIIFVKILTSAAFR